MAEHLEHTHLYIPSCWGPHLQLTQSTAVVAFPVRIPLKVCSLPPLSALSSGKLPEFSRSSHRPWGSGRELMAFPKNSQLPNSIFLLWEENFVLDFHLAPFSLNTDLEDSSTSRALENLLLPQRFMVVIPSFHSLTHCFSPSEPQFSHLENEVMLGFN